MSARWIRSFLVVLVVFAFGPLSAQAAKTKAKSKAKEAPPPPAAVETEASAFPPAELTIGVQARDSETEGIGDLLVPIWNPGGTGLLFLNPRAAMTDDDAEEGNLGAGYRQLLPKLGLILGANFFYDYRDTGSYNYDQWGFGLELLSPWIDARANYYDPDDERRLIASDTETSVSQSVRTSSGWRDPYADDHYVLQDYVSTRTVTTTTTTKTFEQFEQALGGYDWEVGLRLPIKSDDFEARVFGGYYDFDRDFGDDAKGWKARTELRVRSTLFLDAGLYENEDLTGSDWFAGARWTTPLDLGQLAKGRNPFGTAKARLRGEPRAASARLTEMVLRDPQIRLEQSKFIENPTLQQETSSSSRSSSRDTYVLMSDIQFVDGDVPVSGDGTAERPFATIQQGANAVFGSRNVYVYNASGPYNENVVLLPDTTLWGSAILIPGYDGKTFGSGIAPVVDGLSMGPSITVADRTTVKGFTVQNTEMGGPDQFVILPGMPTYNMRRVGIYGMNATDFVIDRNTLSGNEVGALFAAEENDLNFLFTDSLATGNDIGAEVLASGGGGGYFFADFQKSDFYRNTGSGLLLLSQNYLESIARFDNGNVSDNAIGLEFFQSGNLLAMSMVSGAQADNNAIGLQTIQTGNLFGLVNISDSEANANGAFGIQNVQYSQIASIGIIGMPAGMLDTADAAASLFGLTLPEEVGLFLSPSGPVTANGNGVFGVQSVVQTDSGLSLGGLFDITANGNGVNGVQSVVATDTGLALGALFDITANGNGIDGINAVNSASHGVAIGLAGSTANLGEIVELGTDVAGLFGLDLPLAITSDGHMEANGNGGVGFSMNTTGSNAAINAVVGLDTLGNGSAGTFLGTYSENLSIAALARLNSSGNAGAGLLFDVYGLDTAAVGILADVNAIGNGDSGITASVDSPDGSAFFLSLSTDVLRPVAAMLGSEFLDDPFEIPGEPFGPVVASGNTGNGFTANVTGDGFAAALLLDTWADNNTGNGIQLNVVATNGPSIAALISSDVVLDLINDMEVLPRPIYFEPLGYVSASGNASNGVVLVQNGTGGAYGILAGVRADDNVLGDGIHADLVSTDGDAYAILIDTDADDNGDDGIDLTLNAYGHALSALIFTDVDFNGDEGVHVVQTSTTGDALALLSGGDAWMNGNVGFWYDLSAASGDAAACLTDTYSQDNGGRGGHFALMAANDAALLVGTNAIVPFSLNFASGLGAGLLTVFADEIPNGSCDFSYNGSGGLQADLTSTAGDVWLEVDGATAYENTFNGFNFSLNAVAGDIVSEFRQTTANGNGSSGINLSLNGAGGTAGAWFEDLETSGNGGNGINVEETYNGIVNVGGQYLVSQNNTGNGVRLVMSGLTVPVLDFGGGLLGSVGQSSIFGNGNRDFRYNNGGGTTVMAENNWWGVAPPVNGQFAGSIDRNPWLTSDPNAP